jgi:hypothetical protein
VTAHLGPHDLRKELTMTDINTPELRQAIAALLHDHLREVRADVINEVGGQLCVLLNEAVAAASQPRVWLDGDTVPGSVFVYRTDTDPADENAIMMPGYDGDEVGIHGFGDVVEILIPEDADELVQAERARRGQ